MLNINWEVNRDRISVAYATEAFFAVLRVGVSQGRACSVCVVALRMLRGATGEGGRRQVWPHCTRTLSLQHGLRWVHTAVWATVWAVAGNGPTAGACEGGPELLPRNFLTDRRVFWFGETCDKRGTELVGVGHDLSLGGRWRRATEGNNQLEGRYLRYPKQDIRKIVFK